MNKPPIIVSGANGQLGQELKAIAHQYPGFDFHFFSRNELSIEDPQQLEQIFQKLHPAYFINCAAYTAVDKAESEKEQAFQINASAVGTIAALCTRYACSLMHISTDYVFDGSSAIPYREESATGPINVYGESKLEGERLCQLQNSNSLIIRTSWVYSRFGHNFVNTMLRLLQEKPSIRVVNDQVGSPTYGADLAKAIMEIVASGKWVPGVYHYSNSGQTSWFGFAREIASLIHSDCRVEGIPSSEYPTAARRPAYSLLNSDKIARVYGLRILDWKESLRRCLSKSAV